MGIRLNFTKDSFQNTLKRNSNSFKDMLINKHSSSYISVVDNEDVLLNDSIFKRLELQYIRKLWVEKRDYNFLISLDFSELNKLEQCDITNFINDISDKLDKFNIININRKLKVDSCNFSNNSLKQEAQKISSNNRIIFNLENKGISIFFRGKIIGRPVFYSDEDYAGYSNRKPISQLYNVLMNYKNFHLHKYGQKFFYNDISNKKIVYKNILKYNPEELMKEDLKEYLTEQIQHTFIVNAPIVDSNKTIDIYTIAEDKLYFISVEWLGKSINICENKIERVHNEQYVQSAITRSLDYIRILKDDSDKRIGNSIERGYLTIFDAREESTGVQCNLNTAYMDLFTMLEIFEIKNTASA